MTSQIPSQARSIYRTIIRELPYRSLSSRPPLQTRLRTCLAATTPANEKIAHLQFEEADQFAQYIRAQRKYVSLLERYNPGADMEEEERVRLTARRVGMELPPELKNE